ncbi:MAG: DMP19 family protein, partial [Maribacter sp.]|nr:DMP19 family protein [Maribacter sp.]
MDHKVEISKKAVDEFEGNYWNQFNDYLANSDIDDLSGLLRKCYLIYWYASEVCNGGHGQYFDNQSKTDFNEVVEALKSFKAIEHSKLLKDAISIQPEIFNSLTDEEIEKLGEKENELDSRFHETKIDLFN